LRSTAADEPSTAASTSARFRPLVSLIAKDLRMAAHNLFIQVVENIMMVKLAVVSRHLRIKQHLKQKIAHSSARCGQSRRSMASNTS